MGNQSRKKPEVGGERKTEEKERELRYIRDPTGWCVRCLLLCICSSWQFAWVQPIDASPRHQHNMEYVSEAHNIPPFLKSGLSPSQGLHQVSKGRLSGIPRTVNLPDRLGVIMVVDEVVAECGERVSFFEVAVIADRSLAEEGDIVKAELDSDQFMPPFLRMSLPATFSELQVFHLPC